MSAKFISPPLQQFASTFGDPSNVINEIEQLWKHEGRFLPPEELYDRLLAHRVEQGKINVERAKILKAEFHQSYIPEDTTGYAEKHRLPLTDALAQYYVGIHDDQQAPLIRIEGDIRNLAGLNDTLGGRETANKVVGVMTGLLRKELENYGKVTAIRSGGDEITLYVSPNTKKTIEDIKHALQATTQAINKFVNEASLNNIAHTKQGKPPGVGLLFAAIEMTGNPDMDKRVLYAKIGDARGDLPFTEPEAADPSQVKLVLSKYAPEGNSLITKPIVPGHLIPGDTPEQARHTKLMQALQSAGEGELTSFERQAIDSTHQLTAKTDPLNGLPMFGNMQSELFPHFQHHHDIRGARLVHIDFNNMEGGNMFSPNVGDAMGRFYADCVQEALQNAGLKDYDKYLTSKSGGKFALLLPASVQEKTLQMFDNALKEALMNKTLVPLDLTPEQLADMRQSVDGTPSFKAIYTAKELKRLKHADRITLADIRNPRYPAFKGSAVVTCSAILPDQVKNNTLRDLVSDLEQQTISLMNQIMATSNDTRNILDSTASRSAPRPVMPITNSDFDPKYNFGEESILPLASTFEKSSVSFDELRNFLQNMINNLEPTVQERWQIWLDNNGIQNVLGVAESYEIKNTLQKLRANASPVTEVELLKRAFALLSCDLLDPVSVEKQNPLQFYNDLSLMNKEIRPFCRISGAAHFLVLNLYADGNRVIRFHVYPPSPNNDNVSQDAHIHTHASHTGSLILAGALVNQQFDMKNEIGETDYGLYQISYDRGGQTSRLTKTANANAITRSSYVYKPGEHYHVAGLRTDNLPYPVCENDEMRFHWVGNQQLTATVFSADMSMSRQEGKGAKTLLPQDGQPLGAIHSRNHDVKDRISPDQIESLLDETDKKIKQELAEVRKPSTVIGRGFGNIIASRAPFYRKSLERV